jgi:hypothetical protein
MILGHNLFQQGKQPSRDDRTIEPIRRRLGCRTAREKNRYRTNLRIGVLAIPAPICHGFGAIRIQDDDVRMCHFPLREGFEDRRATFREPQQVAQHNAFLVLEP